MHTLSIPQYVIDRVVQRRGKEHIYGDIDPRKSALVVIDMQNGFMMPGVAHALVETAVEIVPNVNCLAATLRKTGGLVVWIQYTHTEETLAAWSVKYEMADARHAQKRVESMSAGSKGHALWAGLDVRPNDLIVAKTRFSAFIQGSSDLENILRARGIENVIVAGTATNVCCESTARDAMMRNFRTVMVTDANAAATDEDHNATLRTFYFNFGDIMPTALLIACLERTAEAAIAKAG